MSIAGVEFYQIDENTSSLELTNIIDGKQEEAKAGFGSQYNRANTADPG